MLSVVAVDLKNGKGSVYEGEPKTGKAGCTLTLDDDDLVAMVTGKMNAQKVSSGQNLSMVWFFKLLVTWDFWQWYLVGTPLPSTMNN